MKPLLVVNPASCAGRTGRLFTEVRGTIERALGECDVQFTTAPAEATEIARRGAEEGRDRIIAVGGDGTFGEIAAGVLLSGRRVPVGLIHQGTGGDFRKSLGIEHRLDRYIEVINEGHAHPIDMGEVTCVGPDGSERKAWFVNAMSVGMGGLVGKYVAEGGRLMGPKATYFMASLKALFTGAAGRCVLDLTLDGQTQTHRISTRNLAVCNGQFFGAGMHIAPMARLDDGVFEIVTMGETRGSVLSLSSAIYKGEHLGRAGVQHLRATELTLRLENESDSERFLIDVDGDYIGRSPVTVKVLPGALDVLMPKEGNARALTAPSTATGTG